MKGTVSKIIDKMLVFNFSGKEKLLKQLPQAQVTVDEEEVWQM